MTNMIVSIPINTDLTIIPITRENPTSPSRYSFFSGRKKVVIKSGSENRCKKALLKDKKYRTIPIGASIYQNFKNAIGKKR